MAGIIDRSLKILKAARGVAALRKAEGANDRARAQAALAELFADARGVTMKIGQLFSEMDGGSPFDTLAKGIEPYPLETRFCCKTRLSADFRRPLIVIADVFSPAFG